MIFRYNPYELLYMYRTGDPHALTLLKEAYGGFLNTLVEQTTVSSPDCLQESEDLFLECLLALHDALNCYREDMESSFSTFLTVLARRRIWRYTRKKSEPKRFNGKRDVFLEDAVSETECWYDVLSQRSRMFEPEYATEYRCLVEKLDAMFMKMKTEDQRVLYSWMQGEGYREASARLGLSSKAYDGRLNRLRARVRNAGNPPPKKYLA